MKQGIATLCALALVLSLCGVARAAPSSEPRFDDEAARILYDAGQRLYEMGRYSEALKQFDEAYERSGRAALLYNMGRCHEQLGSRTEAVRAYRDFLAAEPHAKDRPAMEAHILALLAQEPPRVLAAPQPAVPSPPRPLRRYPFIIGGLGLGVLIGSIGTGVSALQLEQRLDERCPLGLCPPTYAEALDDRQLGQRLAVATDVLLGVGGTVTAVGVVCLIVEIVRSRSHHR